MHRLPEKLMPLGIVGVQLRIPFKPLDTIYCCDVRRISGYPLVEPHDAETSLSDAISSELLIVIVLRDNVHKGKANILPSHQLLWFLASIYPAMGLFYPLIHCYGS